MRVLTATRAHHRPPLGPPTSPGTTPPVDPNARPDPESGGRGRLTALEVCGACAGSPHTYLCRRCQGGEEPYTGGVCVRCAAHDQLLAAFAAEHGRLDPAAATLVHALADSRRPRSVLEWLRRPNGGAALLRDILRRGVPLTHEVLDEHDPRAVWTLRQALVQLEVLPTRNEHLAQLTAAARRLLHGLPAHHRHVLAPYVQWHVLPEARGQLTRTGRFTIGQRRAAHRRVTGGAELLGWLDDNHLTLQALTQARLEDWLTTGGIHHRDVADFLNWTRRRGLTDHLRVTRPPRGPAEVVLPDADRWQHLHRCLHDEQLPPDVAAGGGLILLFGLQTARIVELTTDHLEAATTPNQPHHGSTSAPSADFVRVTLTSPPLPVPPALAALLHRLPFQSPGVIPLLPSHTGPTWLFPSRAAGRHIGAAALAARLRAHGIPARPARNAALLALAADLPVAVLSDLLGLSISTAVSWTRQASRDWIGFLSARGPDQADHSAGPR